MEITEIRDMQPLVPIEDLPSREEQIAILEEANSPEGVRRVLKEHLIFAESWQYDIAILWAAQAHLREILPPECFYLAFSGATSSGKTTATRIVTELAGGEFFGGGSLAAMIRTFHEAGAKNGVVGIDEIDANNRRLRGDLEGILRIANNWDAKYKVSVPAKGGTWKPVDLEVGGPKVFNFQSDPDPALLSRAIPMEMPRKHETRVDLNNLYLENPVFLGREWLKSRCAEKVKDWSRQRLKEHIQDPVFLDRVEAFKSTLGRDNQIAALCLAISDVLELGFDASIQASMDAKREMDETNEGLRELLIEFYRSQVREDGNECSAPAMEILEFINPRLEEAKLRPVSTRIWAKIRRDFGFEKGRNVKKDRTKGNKVMHTFDKTVREALGVEP